MTNTTFKKDEVIVLLGAGASVEAGIPHSAAMVREIEKSLHNDWQEFRELYNYVRSAIFYAEGIRGSYSDRVAYNIERLVVALDELGRREEHPLYPFIGAWNPRLAQVAGNDFEKVQRFKLKILEKLRHHWIEIDNYERADYYRGLLTFQEELNFPLHVFSLNYDLCVEKAQSTYKGEPPQRGFDKDRAWSHALLEDATPDDTGIILYKLHGSIDWLFEPETRRLTFSDSPSKIAANDAALIFGTSYKLQYVDPFLFLVYQFRRLSFDARLIVTIGYSFADEHINGILKQALNRQIGAARIVAVSYLPDSDSKTNFRRDAESALGLPDGSPQLIIETAGAKAFLTERLSFANMSALFPAEEALFEEIPDPSSSASA